MQFVCRCYHEGMSVNSQSYPPPFNQGDREHRRVREAEEEDNQSRLG